MKFEYFIASRLSTSKISRQHYSRPIIHICTITICISVILMILSFSIGTGLKSNILNNMRQIESDIIISNINPNKEKEFIHLSNDKLTEIKNINGIYSIDSIITKSAIIKKDNNIKTIILKGISENYEKNILEELIVNQLNLKKIKKNEIIISLYHAQKLNLKSGENCTFYFLSHNNNIQKRKFKVAGIYNANPLFNQTYCFTNKETITKINNWQSNQHNKYEITLNKFHNITDVTQKINDILSYNLIAKSLKKRFQSIFNWINLFDKNILLIFCIMCFICVINMTNTMLIMIIERTRMIGLFKSFGLSNNRILKIFLINSWEITKNGILLGNLIGVSLCFIQKETHLIKLNPESYFMNYLPIEINFISILLISLSTFIIIQISTIIPYFIIQNLSPTKILNIK